MWKFRVLDEHVTGILKKNMSVYICVYIDRYMCEDVCV